MKSISTLFLLHVASSCASEVIGRHVLPIPLQHLMDMSLLQEKETPGVNEAIEEILEVLENMTAAIKTGHDSTQSAINDKVSDVEHEFRLEETRVSNATAKDTAWVECVEIEKSLRKDYDNAMEDYKTAMIAQDAACVVPEHGWEFSYPMPPDSFSCSMSDYYKCLQELDKYNSRLDAMANEHYAAINKTQAEYNEWNAKCTNATTLARSTSTSQDEALRLWNQQKDLCLKVKPDLNYAVCAMSGAFESKCAAVGDYSSLIAATKVAQGSGHSDVDRRSEYDAVKSAECALKEIEHKDCPKNYDQDMGGALDLKEQAVANTQHPDNSPWDCDVRGDVTLNGWTWIIAENINSADDYTKVEHKWNMANACQDDSTTNTCVRNEVWEDNMIRKCADGKRSTMESAGWSFSGDITVGEGADPPSSSSSDYTLAGFGFLVTCKGSSACSMEVEMESGTLMQINLHYGTEPVTLTLGSETQVTVGIAQSFAGYPAQVGDILKLVFEPGGISRAVAIGFDACPQDWLNSR